MHWLSKIGICSAFSMLFGLCYGQKQNPDIEQLIQNLIPDSDEILENPDQYEVLINYLQHPLDLNTADMNDLASLYILSTIQIKNIIEHRRLNGKFMSIYELQAVPKLDLETIKMLQYFVRIKKNRLDNRTFLERLKESDSHYLLFRYDRTLEERKGYRPESGNPYLGNPGKTLLRYRLQRYKDYSFGITLEKDAGEAMSWNPYSSNFYSDFQSFHFSRESSGILTHIVFGDYQLQFGQGLVFSGGFALGKGSETILSTKRSDSNIKPYGSVMEQGYYRGVASKIKLGKWYISPYVSYQNVDAVIQKNENGSYVSSLNSSGLHRTQNEISRKNTLNESLIGMCTTRKIEKGTIGITLSRRTYNIGIKSPDQLHRLHDFDGNINTVGSTFYDLLFGSINVFGEMAVSKSGGKAFSNGLLIPVNRKMDLSILHRYFDPNFHTISGMPFAESSGASNEAGLYLGLDYRKNRKWRFRAYFDAFRNLWIKTSVKKPGIGREAMLRADHRIARTSRLMVQYRYEEKDRSFSGAKNNIINGTRRQDEVILQFAQNVTEEISLRTRIQYKKVFTTYLSEGYVISQDVNYSKQKYIFSARMAYFQTGSYDSRFYILERDVLYSLSAPPYYGTGARQYLYLKYRINRLLSFWIKWSKTIRMDIAEIGSGNEQISGNSRNDLRFQLRLSF